MDTGGKIVKNVILRAPLLTMSGYGVHSRQVFRWLETKNVKITSQCLPWGITPWYVNSDMIDGLVGRIMATAAPINGKADISFQVQLPNEWDTNIAHINIGITAAVETDKCNPKWAAACNKMDKIIVPSQFTKSCLTNSGNITTEIEVIPEAFFECLEEESNEKVLDLDFSTDFNFLIFGQVTGHNPYSDRKNTFFMLKWMCEEFKDNPDVGIVIKTNNGRNSTSDRTLTSNMLGKLLSEVRKGPYPKVYMLHGALEQEEIQSVYQNKKIKALVSATRGEGYGLPLLEASVCGLPVMATNFSGHLDFLNKGKFISFNYNLSPVHPSRIDGEIFVQGSRWAEVDEKDFKSKLRKFYKSPQKPKEWAKELSSTLKSEYSQTAINKLYSNYFSKVL